MNHPVLSHDHVIVTTINMTQFIYTIRLITSNKIFISSGVSNNSDNNTGKNYVLERGSFCDEWQLKDYSVKHVVTFRMNPSRIHFPPQISSLFVTVSQRKHLWITEPHDINITILLLLEFPSIVNLFTVNSYFYSLSKDNHIWELLVKRDFPDSVEHRQSDHSYKQYYLFLYSCWNNVCEEGLYRIIRYDNPVMFRKYYRKYKQSVEPTPSFDNDDDGNDDDDDDDDSEFMEYVKIRCQNEALAHCSSVMIEYIGNTLCHLDGGNIFHPGNEPGDRLYTNPNFPNIMAWCLEQNLLIPASIFCGIFLHLIEYKDETQTQNKIQTQNREIVLLLLSNTNYRTRYDYGSFGPIIGSAIASRNLEFLEFMISSDITTIKFVFSETRFKNGILRGDIDLIRFYIRYGYTFSSTNPIHQSHYYWGDPTHPSNHDWGDQSHVLESNSIPLMELFIEEGMSFCEMCVIDTIRRGKLNVESLEWLSEREFIELNSLYLDTAIGCKQNDIANWLLDNDVTPSEQSLNYTLLASNPIILDRLISMGTPLTGRHIRDAIRYDGTALLDVLEKHSVHFSIDHANLAFTCLSLKSEHWLQQRGLYQDIVPENLLGQWKHAQYILSDAAKKRDLTTIESFGKRGIFPMDKTISLLVKREYTEILDYLADHHVFPSEIDIEYAARYNMTTFQAWWRIRGREGKEMERKKWRG